MSYWDGNKVVHIPTIQSKKYPGWDEVDCGCCAGIEWGGEEPRECKLCNGNGIIFKHRKSGVRAEYPGGRFI